MPNNRPTIAIDGLIFQASLVGGVSRVWRSLLTEWAKTDFAPHILVLSRGGTAPEISSLRYCTIPPYDYADTERDRLMLQQVCDAENVDIFVSTYYTTPISTPSICLVYDMIPEVFQVDLSQPVWQEKHRAIRQAFAHAAISQSTANDLARFFPHIAMEEIAVAYCGVEPTFALAKLEQIQQFRDRYQLRKPYYLIVGANRIYKRYRLFFEAFSQLPNRQEFDIVWVGNDTPLSAEFLELSIGSEVHLLPLKDEELAIAYSSAIALAFPSLYEGFGLPLLEAISCGCPVITCENSSIPEVVNDTALYIEVGNPHSFVTALTQVQNPRVRNAIVVKGLERSQQFSWEKMANKLKVWILEIGKLLKEQTSLDNLECEGDHFIIFPDWTQSTLENTYAALESVLRDVLSHENFVTLLVYAVPNSAEKADEIIGEVVMNLLLEAEIDLKEEPNISIVSDLSQGKFSQTYTYVPLENEDRAAVAQFRSTDT
ncbi:hypothetical protein TUMEXPCC7403_09850 [Tumidithrix helvetica PCC 7403]|uniref:glycosyltransferase family 4 protein n=1 Tax=Tumidithrix helvetica TaxID=3457545 RepID=UPI003C963B14